MRLGTFVVMTTLLVGGCGDGIFQFPGAGPIDQAASLTVGEVTLPLDDGSVTLPFAGAGSFSAALSNESAQTADVTFEFFLVDSLIHRTTLRQVMPGTFTSIAGPEVASALIVSGVNGLGAPLPQGQFVFEVDVFEGDTAVYVISDEEPDVEPPDVGTDGPDDDDVTTNGPVDPDDGGISTNGTGDMDTNGTETPPSEPPNPPSSPPTSIVDCNTNGVDDGVEVAGHLAPDCNGNGVPDECDIAAGDSADIDGNENPDECDPDCNTNGLPDGYDLASGTSLDLDSNGIPDECFIDPPRIVHLFQDNGAVRDGHQHINPDGPASIQARTKGLTRCTIIFSEDVAISPADVIVRDLSDSEDLAAPTLFEYDALEQALTLRWPDGTFDDEWIRIHILDSVNSARTLALLDGEIMGTNGPALDGTLPSGDGVAGGVAMFVLGALTGDVTGDRQVRADDQAVVRNSLGSTQDIPADVNGDGVVSAEDQDIVRARLNHTLPPLPSP